jgi:hypothetical protein
MLGAALLLTIHYQQLLLLVVFLTWPVLQSVPKRNASGLAACQHVAQDLKVTLSITH